MSSVRSRMRILGAVGAMAAAIPISAATQAAPSAHAAGRVTRITGTSIGSATLTNTPISRVSQTPSQVDLSTETPKTGPSDNGGYPINVNRTPGIATKGNGRPVTAGGKAKSNPAQITSFEGLNHYMSRFANNGNQFSLEPPDQALCAGAGYVVEGVNDAIAVYAEGATKTQLGYTSLNQFYNFAPAINRSTSPIVFGPEVTDPACYFDPATQRFYFSVLTLNVAPDGNWYGGNELDLAVSNSSNPLQGWNLYRLDVTGAGPAGCPCLADYPKIGADSNGIYITVDDFPLAGAGLYGSYNEADIYALSKQQLLNGNLAGFEYQTNGMVNDPGYAPGDPGYVVWPTTAPAGKYEGAHGGTEYFLSSTYDACLSCNGSDNRVAVWALTNTSNLSSTNLADAPTLSDSTVNVDTYTDPPLAQQPAGDNPTGYYFYGQTAYGQTGYQSSPIATNDSGTRGAVFANGKLWGDFNTAVTVNGQPEAGVQYVVLVPSVSSDGTVSAKLFLQGTLALANESLIFPSLGVTPSGRGVLSFTETGPQTFPSAAYAPLDAKVGAGPVTVSAQGQDAQDGFSEYGVNPRPRWGDYGATAVDGNVIWMGAEYIAHACTATVFATDTTCGGTRTAFANWSTALTAVNLQP